MIRNICMHWRIHTYILLHMFMYCSGIYIIVIKQWNDQEHLHTLKNPYIYTHAQVHVLHTELHSTLLAHTDWQSASIRSRAMHHALHLAFTCFLWQSASILSCDAPCWVIIDSQSLVLILLVLPTTACVERIELIVGMTMTTGTNSNKPRWKFGVR